MAKLAENAITKLATSAALDLNQAADTEIAIYTVPASETHIITHLVCHSVTGDPGTAAVVTFGETGGTCDEFLGDQTLTALDGTTKYVILYPDQGTSQTPEGGILWTAGTIFGIEVTTDAGEAATMIVDVFGYLI